MERRFQETRDECREVVLKLDSKELEKQITLNPPPEVRPLLDRVVIPILELKSREMERVNDIVTIELTKAKMRQVLTALAQGKIAVLFIGKKRPDEYLEYVKGRIGEFKGLLVCSRGTYANLYDKLIHSKLIEIIKEKLSPEIEVLTFEGVLTSEESCVMRYKYVLFLLKEAMLVS